MRKRGRKRWEKERKVIEIEKKEKEDYENDSAFTFTTGKLS